MDGESRVPVNGGSVAESSRAGVDQIDPPQARSTSAGLPRFGGLAQDDPPHISDHELFHCIGRGSYGEVWLARNVFNTFRAVKIVHRGAFANERPFEREFTGIQNFEPVSRSHESQVDILHIGRTDHYFYYVMELADNAGPGPMRGSTENVKYQGDAYPSWGSGTYQRLCIPSEYVPRTLKLEVSRRGSLPVSECLDIGVNLTTALAHLHKHGLVHRDVKPSNVIFVNGVPKLADIGLVTGFDATISCVGTEGFLPVEGPGTPQADLYALGKLLYEISSGKDRLDYPEPPTLLTELPDRQQFLELGEIIKKACARSSADRYQSAEAMQADLLLLKAGKSVRQAHHIERRLKLMTRIAIAITAAVLLGVVPYWFAIREVHRARRAEAVKEKIWDSYLSEAKAQRSSHRMGRRFEGLESLRRAAEIRPSLELRNEAIACLALPDFRLVKQWDGLLMPNLYLAGFDFEHQRYVRSDTHGNLSVRSLNDDRELFSLPGKGIPANLELGLSPNRRYLLAGYSTDHVVVWDLSSRTPVLTLTNFWCRGFTFSADEQTLAIGERIAPPGPGAQETGVIRLYDWVTRKESRSIPLPALQHSFRFDPAGRKLAISYSQFSRVVEIRDVASGLLERSMDFPSGVNQISWHPDGKLLAAAGVDSVVYLWDLSSTNPPSALTGHTGPVIAAQFSDDGNWLATGAWDGTFRLWNPVAKREIFTSALNSTFFWKSKDDRWWGHLVGSTKLGIWEAARERELRQIRKDLAMGENAIRANVSPGGDVLAVSYTDGVRIWNLRSCAELAFLPIGWTFDVAFTQKGTSLLTCSDAGLQEWPLVPSNDRKTLTFREARLLSAPGKALGVSAGKNEDLAYVQAGTVHLINKYTGQKIDAFAANFPFTQITFSPDRRLFAAWGRPANEFQVWEVESHKLVRTFRGIGSGVAVFSPNGRWLALGDRRGYQVIQVANWKTLLDKRTDVDCQVFNFAFSPDNQLLSVSHDSAEVRLLDTATWKEVARLEGPDKRPVIGLNFGPDGSQLVATCDTQVIQLWDLRLIRSELAAMHLDWDLPPYPNLAEEEKSLSARALPTSAGR